MAARLRHAHPIATILLGLVQRLVGSGDPLLDIFLHVELGDPDRHAEYSRTMYAAWFHDQAMRSFVPPLSLSPTGAVVAARLRRDGFDWRERYAAVRSPVLLIHGVEDALPIAEAHASAALIPGARVVEIPEAGHMPFFENPEPCFAAALAFLDAPHP